METGKKVIIGLGAVTAISIIYFGFTNKGKAKWAGFIGADGSSKNTIRNGSTPVNKQSCPEGYSLYTNALNGHSICVKLSTGEIKPVINS